MILAHGDLTRAFLAQLVFYVVVGSLGGVVAVKLACQCYNRMNKGTDSGKVLRVPGVGQAFVIAAVTVVVLLGPLMVMLVHGGSLRTGGTILLFSFCVSLLLMSVLIAWSCRTKLRTAVSVTALAYLIDIFVCMLGLALLEWVASLVSRSKA